GALGGTQLRRDLLVDLALHHPLEDLPLARRQRVEQFTQRIELLLLSARRYVLHQRLLDHAEQILRRHWLGEKVLRARLDGPHSRRNVGVAGQEDDRHRGAELAQAILQIRSAQTRDAHVEKNASGLALVRQTVQQ